MSRRTALGTLGGLIVGGVVGVAGGYYAGMSAVPAAPAGVTSTVTQTVTGPGTTVTATGAAGASQHFKGLTIRYIQGGSPGDTFSTVLQKGAVDAGPDMGCTVNFEFGQNWDPEYMVTMFRDAVAAKPDGIEMMGHPGEDALRDLIDSAYSQGIVVTMANTDLPNIRKKYASQGCGYVGQDLAAAGTLLGNGAIAQLGLKAGDRALCQGEWSSPGRYIREQATCDAFTAAGLTVDKQQMVAEWHSDPTLMFPAMAGYVASHPDVKVMELQRLGAGTALMKALGKPPGSINLIGFDINSQTLDAFTSGCAQLTLDQQPYMQGYLPIVNLCMAIKYKLSGLYMDTGAGLINQSNYKDIADLVKAGYR
jgi:simple sugar transport system substrate-binding protein